MAQSAGLPKHVTGESVFRHHGRWWFVLFPLLFLSNDCFFFFFIINDTGGMEYVSAKTTPANGPLKTENAAYSKRSLCETAVITPLSVNNSHDSSSADDLSVVDSSAFSISRVDYCAPISPSRRFAHMYRK